MVIIFITFPNHLFWNKKEQKKSTQAQINSVYAYELLSKSYKKNKDWK